MKNILLITLLLTLASPVSAVMPYKKGNGITRGKAKLTSSRKFITNKQIKNIIGTWTLRPSNGTSSTYISIGSVVKSTIDKKVAALGYSVLDSTGTAYTGALVGYGDGKRVYLTIPYTNGYSHISITLNKRGNVASYIEQFISNSICSFSNSYDSSTGLEIYNCIFPGAEVGDTKLGTGFN